MSRIHPFFPTPAEVKENPNHSEFFSDHLPIRYEIPGLGLQFPIVSWNVLAPNAASDPRKTRSD